MALEGEEYIVKKVVCISFIHNLYLRGGKIKRYLKLLIIVNEFSQKLLRM